MHGESLFHALGFKIVNKLCTHVFASTIRVKNLDLGILLHVTPCLIFFVGFEGLILHSQEVEVSHPHGIDEHGVCLGM